MPTQQDLGISGRIARAFQSSAITPLLAILGLLFGLFAVVVTPKEEEPQIDVTFADVFVPFPGATPREVESLVTLPTEQIISELKGIDTLYSFSQPDGALFIVAFDVGISRNDAIVKLYNQLYSNQYKLPLAAGVGEPQIKPRGIDDVPIVSLTLWSKDSSVSAEMLTQVANGLETEIKRIPGTREISSFGDHQLSLNVRIDPVKMNYYGVSFDEMSQSLLSNNHISMPSSLVQGNQEIKVQAGQFLQNIEDVKQLVVAVKQDSQGHSAPVYLADFADITLKAALPTQSAWHGDKQDIYPAVTLAIGKQPGENAVDVANNIMQRIETVQNVLLPKGVEVSVSRNYGETAGEKANTLILKLMFATAAVVLLVLITMGLRESAVVGIAIIITLALTLFASWAWGFTLNRISLFALIFSIGILVDDAIVVVENIHRHMAMGKRSFTELIPIAVDEVGGPTILATFTVIAALLPMAFVSGLMGPYMSPIPINASMGMLISLAVAFMVTPWLSRKLLRKPPSENTTSHAADDNQGVMFRLFNHLIGPFVKGLHARKARFGLAAAIFILIAGAVALPMAKLVVLKMLPFDNKSEFQIMVDLPEGTPVEQTQKALKELGRYLNQVEEVANYQLYAGTSAPINFNGLVRHYFLRQTQELGDIQVNLVDKKHRDRDSHSIALSVRAPLQTIGAKYNANIKVVEVPPGPPVWSPILAEVYGPSEAIREQAAEQLLGIFKQTQDVVDIDIYLPAAAQKWQVIIDRSKASLLGVPYQQVVDLIATSVGGKNVSYLHKSNQKYPVPINLQLQEGAKVDLDQVLNLTLRGSNGKTIAVSELVRINKGHIDAPIIHKNMIPMIMVVADMAGPLDSPLYGMFDMVGQINKQNQSNDHAGFAFKQHYIEQPSGIDSVAVLWDGEWKITYETFRDMGIAYAVGMIAIYLLVVAQFKSYLVPLIIMAPIPLTIIGVMPGHALLGAQFTATSMIGMIALAGIIVRNSILLVDFIHQQTAAGVAFQQAVIHSGAVRAKPIMLTALAAMIGALFIIDDPIFNGLAISLIFGILISTLLTLVVIPVLYYAVMKKRYP
ncbi:efflux RND transporter permease subunit [Shewanella pneumatophori]|uniref:Efflux RND transporter permease subunit n=1 Tax=Shewanella pneumatophori TaxID=314092 RepID=A0A9X1ZGV8_9GAMM|nr:efflux RND transporter permease subunit [Shewanella pneumatophori]MCL1139210.1 efflux RND transporter permease subunit [Shewanella pneumatophori]